MKLRAEYIIGKEQGNEWSGIYGYKPIEENEQKVEMFAVMRLQTEVESASLERVAKLLIEELEQAFFEEGEKNKDEIIRLEDSVWKVKSKMDIILSREAEIVEKGLDVEMGIVVIENEILYAAVVGESKILIRRNQNLVDITKALVDANMMGFVKTGSLKMESNDRIALMTSKAFEYSYDTINTILDKLNIQKLGEIKEKPGIAALILAKEELQWQVEDPKVQQEQKDLLADLPVAGAPAAAETLTDDIDDNQETKEIENFEDNIQKKADLNKFYEKEPDAEPLQKSKSVSTKANLGIKDKLNLGKSKLLSTFNELSSKLKARSNSNADIEKSNIEDEGSEELEYIEDEEDLAKEAGFKQKLFSTTKALGNSSKNIYKSKIKPLFKDNQKTYVKVIRDISTIIKNLISNVAAVFKKEIIGSGDRRDIYLRGNRTKRNRRILAIILVIAVVLIFFALRDAEAKRKENERVQTAKSKLIQIQNDADSIASQVEVAKTQDEQKKNLILNKIDSIEGDITKQKKESLFLDELAKVNMKLEDSRDNLLLIKAVTPEEIQLIADVGKLFPDATLSDIVYSDGFLYVSDSSRGVIYKLEINLNATPKAIATGLTQPLVLVKNVAGDIIVYDNDSNSSMGKVTVKDEKFTRYPNLTPNIIGKIASAAIYSGNDALYEIHQNHQQIFKREREGAAYKTGGALYITANPPNWKTDPSFVNAIDVAAPYEIYILVKGSGLERYLAGGSNTLAYESYLNFMQKDFDSIKDAACFDISGKYMAICDPLNKRVMLFEIQDTPEKNLVFLRQYVYRGNDTTFSTQKEIAVNDTNNTIYVLDGTKIIKLSI